MNREFAIRNLLLGLENDVTKYKELFRRHLRRRPNEFTIGNVVDFFVKDQISAFSKVKLEDKEDFIEEYLKYHDINCNIPNEGVQEAKLTKQSKLNSYVFGCGAAIIAGLMLLVCSDYIRRILLWLEEKDPWISCLVLVALFTYVSFPFAWGYIILNLACGYIFGLINGVVVVSLTSNAGIYISHQLTKSFLKDFFKVRLTQENVNALLTILSTSQAFKIVMLSRLTPIPIGIQNAIFAISNIKTLNYMTATFLGLLPTQAINVYIGSSVRSMEDVLARPSSAMLGYMILSVQIMISGLLTVSVVRKARSELSTALQSNSGSCMINI